MTKTFPITIINNKPTCAELPGYELPPYSRYQEDDVEAMAVLSCIKFKPDNESDFEEGFISGYYKARERFEFSREDVAEYIEWISGMGWYFDKESKQWEHSDKTGCFKSTIDLINHYHIRTPRTPIAIEVEMAKPSESFGAFVGNAIGEFVPTLNLDGTVKGRWVHE